MIEKMIIKSLLFLKFIKIKLINNSWNRYSYQNNFMSFAHDVMIRRYVFENIFHISF